MTTVDWASVRVLIIDDNAFFREILRTVLSAAGVMHVREAADGDAAMAILHGERVDLILVDYVMAPVDGLSLTRQIRDEATSPDPLVPIIMVSGHLGPSDVQTALNAGIHDIVGKPISARTLLRVVRRVLTEPRAFLRTDTYFGPDHSRRTTDFLEASTDGRPIIIDERAG
jgi:CheY-like chemotaxis protein